MVDVELSEGITEVLEILNNVNSMYMEKLPQKFKDFLEKNKSNNYNSNLDFTKELKDMNLKPETKNLLGIMYLNYWSTEEQKKEYVELLNNNEKKYQDEIRIKYNPDNVFKTSEKNIVNNQENVINDELPLKKEEISFIKKIWNKILSIFKKS